jgi:hypothetical protein
MAYPHFFHMSVESVPLVENVPGSTNEMEAVEFHRIRFDDTENKSRSLSLITQTKLLDPIVLYTFYDKNHPQQVQDCQRQRPSYQQDVYTSAPKQVIIPGPTGCEKHVTQTAEAQTSNALDKSRSFEEFSARRQLSPFHYESGSRRRSLASKKGTRIWVSSFLFFERIIL